MRGNDQQTAVIDPCGLGAQVQRIASALAYNRELDSYKDIEKARKATPSALKKARERARKNRSKAK